MDFFIYERSAKLGGFRVCLALHEAHGNVERKAQIQPPRINACFSVLLVQGTLLESVTALVREGPPCSLLLHPNLVYHISQMVLTHHKLHEPFSLSMWSSIKSPQGQFIYAGYFIHSWMFYSEYFLVTK